MGEAVLATAPDGTVLLWNAVARRFLEYAADEIVGKPLAILIPPDRREVERAAYRQALQGGTIEAFETVRIAKSGRRVELSLALRPIRDAGGSVGVLEIAREREAPEPTSSPDGQSLLRLITDNVPVLISYVDRDLRYRLNNSAYERWFGRSRDEMEGRLVEEVLGPAAWAKVGPHLSAAARGRLVAYEEEVPYAHGGTRWVRATYTPHLAPDGSVLGVVVLVADIAERKRAEDALAETDRRKDEFIAMLAHELRNPLAPLHTALQIVRKTRDSELHAHACGVMDRQLDQLVRLIDDLLDVSRITRGSIELRKERVDLREVVEHALEASLPWIEERRHELRVELPSEPVVLNADPVRLAQVFLNLLKNAASYTDPGGRITLSAERRGCDVDVAVQDTGIGLVPDELRRIFEIFTQSERPAERAPGGLGVGLWIVRRLVELHGGRVEAESAGPREGSTFIVRLPTAEDDSRPIPTSEPTPAVAGEAARILVIDDNQDAAESLAMLLTIEGHDARVAMDGESGLKLAGELRPEIILLDIGLPGRDGYEIAREIRSLPWGSDVILIAATGWGQSEDKARARAAGFDFHLTKPVDLDALARIVRGRARG
jgi:PAS domain S-box-containing protein